VEFCVAIIYFKFAA